MLTKEGMPIVTLRDLYAAELHDLFDAEQQILQELPGMAARATSAELRQAFEEHYEETQVHIERLELLLRQLDERHRLDPCDGVRGIVAGARRLATEAERGEVLDAALIGAAQRIEHQEIAAYGCARTYAHTLGDAEAEHLLQQTLNEEVRADARLTAIAERGINQSAGADLVARPTTYRSRLRYVSASDLQPFSYEQHRITNMDNDDLGVIDGLVADGSSGRPVYYVVDSGGWFTGRRYLLPVSQLELDAEGQRFRTELSRELLHRYPEFSPSAFAAMDDAEAERYERRMLDTVLPYRHDARRDDTSSSYATLPIYHPPGWLMTSLWPMEMGTIPLETGPTAPRQPAPAPAAAPEKAARPRRPAPHDDRSEAEHERDMPQNELLVARGESEGRGERAEQQARGTRRLERYRDR
jgi:ferritin-like metal-binding protein YciE